MASGGWQIEVKRIIIDQEKNDGRMMFCGLCRLQVVDSIDCNKKCGWIVFFSFCRQYKYR